jgi:hypothetical protein
MDFCSMPDYRRRFATALQRIRKDDDSQISNRIVRALSHILILAVLWGVPLYGRWMLLSARSAGPSLSAAVIGKWGSERSFLEFTPDHQIRLFDDAELIETASYEIAGDVLQISDFKLQPGDEELPLNQQCYRISIVGDQLTITPSTLPGFGFTPVPDNAAWEVSRLRRWLPGSHGTSRTLGRSGK